jgi:arylsulfatase A-like enzyme
MASSNDSPLVLLICIDALRYDCVNWQPETPYFNKLGVPRRLNTPTLDRIAEQSVRFPRAVSHAGYTPLSLGTVFTGTYGRTHGVVDFQNTTCRPEVVSLPSLFKRHGWRTCSVCGPEFFTSLGLTRDVDHVWSHEGPLLELLESGPAGPTFAFVHFNDVHQPYLWTGWGDPRLNNRDFELMMQLLFGLWVDHATREFVDGSGNRAGFDKWSQLIATPIPPEAAAGRLSALFRCYLHGIQKFDQTRFADFVERLENSGWWERATVVLFADHGEISMPKAPWALNHDKSVGEQLMRMPLMLKSPRLEPADVRPLVGLVDLFPTIADLLDLHSNQDGPGYELDGRSLLPAIEAGRPVQQDYYHEGWSVVVGEQREKPVLYQRAIRTQNDMKFLFTGDVLDPGEFDALNEEQFLKYIIERGAGEIANAQSREQLRRHLHQGMSRAELANAVVAQIPRCRRFDLKQDPFEEHGQVMEPGKRGWDGYNRELQRMLTLTGRPNYIDDQTALSPEDEQRMLQHLGELGYVET